MVTKFTDWCLCLKPKWVGYVLCLTVVFISLLLVWGVTVFLLIVTNDYVLLVFFLPVLYAIYLAIFKQGDHK